MRFRIENEPWILRGYLQDFIDLAGSELWEKRTAQIAKDGMSSPYREQIVSDYHWVELQLRDEISKRELLGSNTHEPFDPISRRALRFCQTAVEVYRSLSDAGKRTLSGRIRDALQAETGFAALYQEMETAALLISKQFDVSFPDLTNPEQPDIFFQNGRVTGMIECKALSADAGRKVHRKSFYRFMDEIGKDIASRASISGLDELITITLAGRLPSNSEEHGRLVEATKEFLRSPELTITSGLGFTLKRESYDRYFGGLQSLSEPNLYQRSRQQFGDSCHMAGAKTETGCCVILMRSDKLDDHSKLELDAVKSAAKQLPPDLPGFVGLQLSEISSADLALPHLRERSALLAGALFFESESSHVAAVYICAFGAMSAAADAFGYPGIAIWNPNCRFNKEGLPFRSGMPDEAFGRILNNAPASGL